MLDWSKLKEFAVDNFEFDENGRKFSRGVENNFQKTGTRHVKTMACLGKG